MANHSLLDNHAGLQPDANAVVSIRERFTGWVRLLSGPYDMLSSSLPGLEEAFSTDDLPVSFILRRAARANRRRFDRRRDPGSRRALKAVRRDTRMRRADARSTLSANAGRRRPAHATRVH